VFFGVVECVEVVGRQCCDRFGVDYYLCEFDDFEYLGDVVVYVFE